MKKDTVVGLDLAKSVFQTHGNDENGKKQFGKKLKRSEVLPYFAKLPPALVGMEACCGAHEWARQISALGHEVKLMAPQHVKPYVQGNKTDARDAAAIAEAASRKSVPTVAIRSRASQQMQALHRTRELWMKHRIATSNQIRSLLAEFGVVIPQGLKRLKEEVLHWRRQANEEMQVLDGLIERLMSHLRSLEEMIHQIEIQIQQMHRVNPASQLLESIDGVGVMTATAVVASFADCETFASSRKFSSCIGVTPREHSSGGKQVLLGISKRGNGYIRKLLIHGARSVLKARMNKPQHTNDWEIRLAKRRGHNIAAVALAAKNARRIWAILRSGEMFNPKYGQAA